MAARLDALEPSERRVVAGGSVLGLSFTRDAVGALFPDQDVDRTLSALLRKQILSLQTDRLSAERGQYRFVQTVVRQVAYDTLSRRDRKARHLAVVRHLEAQLDPGDELAAVIAQHLIDAAEAEPDDSDVAELNARATELLERAARRAHGLGAPGEALRLLRLAIARTRDDAVCNRLQVSAARAALDSGDFETAIELGAAAAAGFDTRGRRCVRGDGGRRAGTGDGSVRRRQRGRDRGAPAPLAVVARHVRRRRGAVEARERAQRELCTVG